MKGIETANPFTYDYIFSKDDMSRSKLSFSDKIWTLLHPMMTQRSDGIIFYYKNVLGIIYLFDYEEAGK